MKTQNSNGRTVKLIGVAFLAMLALLGCYYALFVAAIPRAELEAQYFRPPSRYIDICYQATAQGSQLCGVQVHIRDTGPRDAPALLLLHASNASLFTWDAWRSRLDDRYRIVAMDFPGHGLTGAAGEQDLSEVALADFVRAVADKLHLQQFVLGGNSLGGAVAAHFAILYPQRVSGLILVDSGGPKPIANGDTGTESNIMRLLRAQIRDTLMAWIAPRFLVAKYLHFEYYRQDLITSALVDRVWQFNRMDGNRTLRRRAILNDPWIRKYPDRIRARTLIIWGAHDRVFPLRGAQSFFQSIPGAKVVVLPDAGHHPQEESPDRSAALVRAFLGGTPVTNR
ncbi:MAG TPA: alpha/beta hydrolase [Rhizomicrobium sp.]|nr:alpha/beta hydrolase [Rhizomicrobium sp.]